MYIRSKEGQRELATTIKTLRRSMAMVLQGTSLGAQGGLWGLLVADAPGGVGYSGRGAGADELDRPVRSASAVYQALAAALPPPVDPALAFSVHQEVVAAKRQRDGRRIRWDVHAGTLTASQQLQDQGQGLWPPLGPHSPTPVAPVQTTLALSASGDGGGGGGGGGDSELEDRVEALEAPPSGWARSDLTIRVTRSDNQSYSFGRTLSSQQAEVGMGGTAGDQWAAASASASAAAGDADEHGAGVLAASGSDLAASGGHASAQFAASIRRQLEGLLVATAPPRTLPLLRDDGVEAAAAAEEARLFGVGLGPSGGVHFEAFVTAALREVDRRRVAAGVPPRTKSGKRAALRRALVGREAVTAQARTEVAAAVVSSSNPVLGRVFNTLDVEQRGALDLEQARPSHARPCCFSSICATAAAVHSDYN